MITTRPGPSLIRSSCVTFLSGSAFGALVTLFISTPLWQPDVFGKVSQLDSHSTNTFSDHPLTPPPLAPKFTETTWDICIVIPSAAQERKRRDAIRATWVKMITSETCEPCSQKKVMYRFVVGNEGDLAASHLEAAESKDLAILEDFGQHEAYTLRSQKTLRSIRYVVQHFDFRFLLKCDTDSWVHVDRLLNLFDRQTLWHDDRLYGGVISKPGKYSKPDGRPGTKWYEGRYKTITGFDLYPIHAKGAGYVLSRSLAEGIARQPIDFWAFVNCEDVAVGFWLFAANKTTHHFPFSLQPKCNEDVVIDHYVTPDVMIDRWRRYEAFGNPCAYGTA